MGLPVNPKEDGGEFHPRCTGGDKLVAVVGIIMGRTNSRDGNSKPKADIHLTCLKDMDGNGEEGADAWDTLFLTENAKWRIANCATAARYEQPFDAHNQEQLFKALTNRPYIVSLVPRKGDDDKTYYDVKQYKEYNGDVSANWRDDKMITEAIERHKEAVERKAKKAARDSGGGSSQPSTGGGEPSANDYNDQDIPF